MIKKIMTLVIAVLITTSVSAGNFWQKHTVIMLFSSTCPHCHAMGNVFDRWLKDTNIPFEAYSLDGRGLPTITYFKRPPKQLLDAAFPEGKIVYPATYIIANSSRRIFPIAIGEVSYSELSQRVSSLVPKIIRYEGNRNGY